MHCNCISFLKIYLFIAPTCFGYSLAIIRVLVIWYNVRQKCAYFQDTVIYISVLWFYCCHVWWCVRRVTRPQPAVTRGIHHHTQQYWTAQHIFDILFVILSFRKYKASNSMYSNKCTIWFYLASTWPTYFGVRGHHPGNNHYEYRQYNLSNKQITLKVKLFDKLYSRFS